jgi:hypothetical protein
MSQVVVRSPLEELELADEDGLQPYALGHLRLREPLAPSPTPRLWKIDERALVDYCGTLVRWTIVDIGVIGV